MQKTISRTKHRSYHPRVARHNSFNLSSKLDQIRSSLSDISDNVSDRTSSALKSAKKQSTHIKRSVGRYVSKNPYKTTLGVTVAAATALCIGYFIRK